MVSKISGISKSEKQRWQAEDDARTLASYQEILNDRSRMNRAIKEAERQAKDLNKRANVLSSVVKSNKGGTARKKK